jgi:hypothetical protein
MLDISYIWFGEAPEATSHQSCMERVFLMYEDVENFYVELKNGALEGLCDCVRGLSSSWRKRLNCVV